MNHTRSVLLILILVCAPALAEDTPFPSAPPNFKEAETSKLERVTLDELKQLLPATMEMKKSQGGRVIRELKPDGTATANVMETARKGGATVQSGTWRIEEKKGGGVYCVDFGTKARACYTVFKAGDGVHYFDYIVNNGFFDGVWRPVKK
jgi:hypothetical protein